MILYAVEVTQEDIDLSIRCNSFQCPIANALNRLNDEYNLGFKHIVVYCGYFYLDDEIHDLTSDVAKWIYLFDNRKKVPPITFPVVL